MGSSTSQPATIGLVPFVCCLAGLSVLVVHTLIPSDKEDLTYTKQLLDVALTKAKLAKLRSEGHIE